MINMSQIILALLLITTLAVNTDHFTTQLQNNWSLKILGGSPQAQRLKTKTYSTTIPTTVHLDLLEARDIPDPFVENNYPTVRWVSDLNIVYSTKFNVPAQAFKLDHQQLVFQGIDTYSQIKLNGKVILNTQNAFRKYEAEVKSVLKQGQNVLQVYINSTNQRDNKGQASDSMPFNYAHTRKACYQYSWDWAPFLNTMGIWKRVYLRSFRQVVLDYVWVRTRFISKQKATVNFAVALKLAAPQLQYTYQFKVFHNDKQLAAFPAKERYSYYDVHIPEPKLWWPNGIGQPFIYDFVLKLVRLGQQQLIDQKNIPFGIRTVQLDLANKNFQVKVNGYSIYCKGSNYVPPDMFYPRLQNKRYKPGNTIEQLLNDAQQSHFNMIRVWGGGQYQSQKFLQIASRKGIMIFYDFMFSDSVYPSTQNFLLNVQQQIKQQIRIARNYPCLALWSGNNQILQGIQDWGWGTPKYRQDYRKLFEVLIPKIIQYQSPYIPYIPSSPVYGVGNYGIQRGGDAHFWSVWAGGADFQTYQKNVAKFNSQFGTQALPVWQTIIQAIDKNPSYDSSTTLLHQRHSSRFQTLKSYMQKYMKTSLNFRMQTYQSGLLQAFAIQLAIKAQRIAKPKSWGTLYWQMNDAWPGISWSSIDYFGRWKPLQFMAKRLYPDVAILVQEQKVYVVNDKLYEISVLAVIKFFSLKGQVLNSIQKKVTLKANQVQEIHHITGQDTKNIDRRQVCVYTQVVAGKNEHMSSTHFNVHFNELDLVQASITVQYHPEFNQMTLQSNGPVVKNLFISHETTYLKLSDNYFDLVPGHPVKVIVLHKNGLQKLKQGIRFTSYREVYTANSSVRIKVK